MQLKEIKTARAQKMLVNRIMKELEERTGFFQGAKIKKNEDGAYCSTIRISNEYSNMLTFYQIDKAREVVKKYADKYGEGSIYAIMDTEPYLAKFGEVTDWLSRPVMEIAIWRKGEA